MDEHTVTIGFHQWLASVTERIHLTMHYQNNGKAQLNFNLEPTACSPGIVWYWSRHGTDFAQNQSYTNKKSPKIILTSLKKAFIKTLQLEEMWICDT